MFLLSTSSRLLTSSKNREPAWRATNGTSSDIRSELLDENAVKHPLIARMIRSS